MVSIVLGYEISRDKVENLEKWVNENEERIDKEVKNDTFFDNLNEAITKYNDSCEKQFELDPCFIGTTLTSFDDDSLYAPAKIHDELSSWNVDDLYYITSVLRLAIKDGVDIGDLKDNINTYKKRFIELF